MIDFDKEKLFHLGPIEPEKVVKSVNELLVEGEEIISAFKTMRDQVIFTNKRIITVNLQGLTGKKTDYTSIPYSKVISYSIETAGFLDLDCELEIYVSYIGKLRFEIKGSFDIIKFNQIISKHIL